MATGRRAGCQRAAERTEPAEQTRPHLERVAAVEPVRPEDQATEQLGADVQGDGDAQHGQGRVVGGDQLEPGEREQADHCRPVPEAPGQGQQSDRWVQAGDA